MGILDAGALMLRAVVTGALLLFGSSVASAQITTYVAYPKEPIKTPAMVAAADSAKRDSIADVAMTNMKAWVDSAAGVSVPATVGRMDTSRVVDTAVTTFSNGTVAPATASALPAMLVLGLGTMMVGAALLATRQRG
jgi:hypothetical protein